MVHVLFAGELTWGDSPTGAGYKVLESLSKLGLENKFFGAIKWGRRAPVKRRKR